MPKGRDETRSPDEIISGERSEFRFRHICIRFDENARQSKAMQAELGACGGAKAT
jgi:hypothetical protein